MITFGELSILLNKAQRDAGLYYVGIFVKDTEIISKTSSRSSKLSSYFGRLIERSLELNNIIPNFKEEFLFSEGKDFSLFVYYVDDETSIGMIHIGKPNFSLLKITATDLAKEITKYIPNIKEIYKEKSPTTQIEATVSDEEFASPYREDSQFSTNDILELEEVLSSKEDKESKEKQDVFAPEVSEPSLEDILKAETKEDAKDSQVDIPSLEDILIDKIQQQDVAQDTGMQPQFLDKTSEIESGDEIQNYDKIIEKISKEFVRIIGPFGLYIFKKKKEQFFKDKSLNKFELLKFIQTLSEEITVESRKQEFIEKAKSLLLNI